MLEGTHILSVCLQWRGGCRENRVCFEEDISESPTEATSAHSLMQGCVRATWHGRWEVSQLTAGASTPPDPGHAS